MRVTSRSAASREAQSESVATSGPVPARVQSTAAAHNRKGPANRSFRGVCPRVSRNLLYKWLLIVVLLVLCDACSSLRDCNGDVLVWEGGIESVDSPVIGVSREIGADKLSELELRLCEIAREFRGSHSACEKANRLRKLENCLSSAMSNGDYVTIDFITAQLGLPAPHEGGGECGLFVPCSYRLFIRWNDSRKIVYSGPDDRCIE